MRPCKVFLVSSGVLDGVIGTVPRIVLDALAPRFLMTVSQSQGLRLNLINTGSHLSGLRDVVNLRRKAARTAPLHGARACCARSVDVVFCTVA